MSAQERRVLLSHLTSLAASDVRALWAAADRLTDVAFAKFVIDGYPQVVEPWITTASDMAAMWFEETIPGPATTVDAVPVERLAKSAQWALGGDGVEALTRLEHTTQRAVFDGARTTTIENVKRTGSRWARDARADACAFCRLLATREGKYLYRSRETAATKVHDDCHCLPIEVANPSDYVLPDYAQQWQDEYRKARANAGSGDPKKVLAAWRTQAAEIN